MLLGPYGCCDRRTTDSCKMITLRQPLNEFWESRWEPKMLMRLRHRSRAREYCRRRIRTEVEQLKVKSILEVGFGGLNERIALQPLIDEYPALKYIGLDISAKAVEHARVRFPNDAWYQGDISRSGGLLHRADVVYAQHLLEHCPTLSPALDYLLMAAHRKVYVIFFNLPGDVTKIQRRRRKTLFNNFYSRVSICSICHRHGFGTEFVEINNHGVATARGPQFETILVATKESG